MRLVALIALCVAAGASGGLLAGCSFMYKPGCLGEFKPNGFTQTDKVLVYEAAQGVNNFIIAHGGDESIAVSDEGLCSIEKGSLEGLVLGKWTGKKILVDTDKIGREFEGAYYPKNMKNVVMHEMLHSLGFQHIQGYGIMNAQIVFNGDFSEGDVAECVRVGVCSSATKDAGE